MEFFRIFLIGFSDHAYFIDQTTVAHFNIALMFNYIVFRGNEFEFRQSNRKIGKANINTYTHPENVAED